MNAIKGNSNFARFTAIPVKYFKVVGISLQSPDALSIKLRRLLTVFNILLLFAHQIAFLVTPGRTMTELLPAVNILNYTTVGGGKIFFLILHRHLLLKFYTQLQAIYPSEAVERHYKLDRYLRIYKRVEIFLYNFFKYIVIIYSATPIAQSFYDLWSNGEYSYRMPCYLWYPVPLQESLFEYVIYMVFELYTCISLSIIILSADLCLYSSVSQLILHLDLLAQRILELQPTEKGSMNALKAIIEYHQQILTLAQNVNTIFAPSIIFNLASSSFILCFSAYQLLDDVSFVFTVKTLLLLCYEMKQVVISCYYGDKLIESSANLFNVIYAHDWPVGTPAYKRLVLIMLMRTYRPITLNVAGITDVSLITLKQVLSTSYQIFAVLKSA